MWQLLKNRFRKKNTPPFPDLLKDLPPGTSFSAVQNYLEQSGLEHSWSEIDQKFYVIYRNIRRGFMTRTSLALEIQMNDDKQVAAIKQKEVHTGP